MFQKISDHVYVFPADSSKDLPNIGLICGVKGSVLFDAGASPEHVCLLQDAMKKQNLPEAKAIIGSHSHWDHLWGKHTWNLPLICTKECNDQLRVMSQWAWTDEAMAERERSGEDINFCHSYIRKNYSDLRNIQVPTADITFEKSLTIDLGDVQCDLFSCDAPHFKGSLVCLVRQSKILFISDAAGKDLYSQPSWVYDETLGFRKSTQDIKYDTEKVCSFLNFLKKLDYLHCIDGHTPKFSYRETLHRQLQNIIDQEN